MCKKLAFSLDWNCILAVENEEKAGEFVEKLADLHRTGRADVAVLQTSASENMAGTRGFPGNYSLFEKRLSLLGWEDFPRVPTPGVWGLTFWGACYWVDKDEHSHNRDAVWNVIDAGIPANFKDFLAKESLPLNTEIGSPKVSRWRNVWCDVHSAIAHIHARRDYFVTLNTRDFQANADSFKTLGLVAKTPREASSLVA